MGWFSNVLKVVGGALLGGVSVGLSVATGGLATPLLPTVIAGFVAGGAATANYIAHGEEPPYGFQVSTLLSSPQTSVPVSQPTHSPVDNPPPPPPPVNDPVAVIDESISSSQPTAQFPDVHSSESGIPECSAGFHVAITINPESSRYDPPIFTDLIHGHFNPPHQPAKQEPIQPANASNTVEPKQSSIPVEPKSVLTEYKKKLKLLENSIKAGFNPKSGKWFIHKDSNGADTIGYGHLVQKNEDFSKGLTDTEVNELFEKDFNKHVKKCEADYNTVAAKAPKNKGVYPTWESIPEAIKVVAIDIAYNVGNLKSFPRFIDAVRLDDKQKMVDQCVNNKNSKLQGVITRNTWRRTFIKDNYKPDVKVELKPIKQRVNQKKKSSASAKL